MRFGKKSMGIFLMQSFVDFETIISLSDTCAIIALPNVLINVNKYPLNFIVHHKSLVDIAQQHLMLLTQTLHSFNSLPLVRLA